ncbi:hypothetical protein PO461_07915 [Enterobacter asburiae]|uniref:hypothetical protein n=1 Tax=Enterobacter asburiae TaxID=61645 RepID=UPI002FFAC553
MTKSAKELYAVPDWMRPYLPLFQNTGGNDVEELLHDDNTSMFANSIRYMLIVSARSQFTLLMGLHERGFLSTVSDAFLAEVRASAIDSLVDIKTKQLADMHPDTHAFGAIAADDMGMKNIDEPRESWRSQFDVKGAAQ